MSDTIAVSGVVATTPNPISTGDGLKITSFRLASTQRRFDRGRDRWVDGETNWYTVTTFRQLAANVGNSVVKGDKVVVTGRLRVREWESGEKKGINVDIEADSVGHDLAWGTTSFTRVSHATVAVEPPATENDEFARAGADLSAGLGIGGGFLGVDSAEQGAVGANDDDSERSDFSESAAAAPF